MFLTGHLPGEGIYEWEPVRGIIAKCTAIDAAQRFQSAEELLQNLRGIMEPHNSFHISWLPGFRSGVVWKNVVAIIGYFVWQFIPSAALQNARLHGRHVC